MSKKDAITLGMMVKVVQDGKPPYVGYVSSVDDLGPFESRRIKIFVRIMDVPLMPTFIFEGEGWLPLSMDVATGVRLFNPLGPLYEILPAQTAIQKPTAQETILPSGEVDFII